MFDKVISFLETTLFTFNDQPITLWAILMVPTWILVSLWLSKLLIKAVTSRMASAGKDPNVIHLVKRILFVIALGIIFLTTLSLINVPITAFAFLSGAVAIGFGFGAQNIINNFISGWILIGEKPIRIGDFLEVEGAKGTVEQINTRSTRIRRTDGVHMLIPNSQLIENVVINWTLCDRLVRGTVVVGVAYGSDVKLVASLMKEVTLKQEQVLGNPEPDVFFQDFGDNALIFESYFWIHSTVEGGIRAVSSQIRFEIYEAFERKGIEIAFPQRDVHIDGEIKVSRER
ncbi:mechanosensitive ion channel family protein [Vibrio natriegens]|uniref:Mechanosensitive ion channel protein n=1 Tax=Vibrio natriegens NBRC 15636 = ATCC 14048 = DSM 759 TaxID=1219067 RepID=A0AAN1CY50_VIBNA|nr:mechanosensitive ion channel domain-containing protein [Vibrio natriegens]ALR18032.1 mechanosensitive ion channel protein [Vibrio natriegens NBRC 15636 = ATCC 14048 = DSM 759]ANQ15532.1 mechanosensitive ion channel protein [Vibrio natriegens NBRC 15636 = ATCC 14048 = DSM 759]EPM41500.1 mechanosensitive ion channel protein [Vibrio natriegens NBRC 15636 = ATCC 14048 = DSM 759]MDX6029104.1 mechanosensitive ion channel [Vibrio natriegens NBRC 15636 = ATCC 14048 = DSM 759]UUI14188.1 mechanosensi